MRFCKQTVLVTTLFIGACSTGDEDTFFVSDSDVVSYNPAQLEQAGCGFFQALTFPGPAELRDFLYSAEATQNTCHDWNDPHVLPHVDTEEAALECYDSLSIGDLAFDNVRHQQVGNGTYLIADIVELDLSGPVDTSLCTYVDLNDPASADAEAAMWTYIYRPDGLSFRRMRLSRPVAATPVAGCAKLRFVSPRVERRFDEACALNPSDL